MGTHVVLLGPSTAGKTSLMLGLSHTEGQYDFTIDRTWTTRSKRPDDGEEENVFVDPPEFDKKRPEFLFNFQTFPTYEYGIEKPAPLSDNEVRMRILMPVFAVKFRQMVSVEPVVLCSISPFHSDPESVFRARDPHIDPEDLQARIQRFHEDNVQADELADIQFQNCEGLQSAVNELHSNITGYLQEKGF